MRLTFTHDPSREDPPLAKRSVQEFAAGAKVQVILDVGMRGRDLDLRAP